MNVVWDDTKNKCNYQDQAFVDCLKNTPSRLSSDDIDFLVTSFSAKMYNYSVEYMYNKAVKILQDNVFSCGEELVLNITHWIDRSFLSPFFDVFVLRIACDFDFITLEEKLEFMRIAEYLQARKDNFSDNWQIDKERAKYFLLVLFFSVLSKDFSSKVKEIKDVIEKLYTIDILPLSNEYSDIICTTNRHKNLLVRIMFCLLKISNKEDNKRYKTLCNNIYSLFPTLWDSTSLNDKKFIAYYLKSSNPQSPISQVFGAFSNKIKVQDITTDINVITKILKNCQTTLSCHFSVSNHVGETLSLQALEEINATPKNFLRSIITPSLVCFLGGNYGTLKGSKEIAQNILNKITQEKWQFYFKNFFEKDDFVQINLITNEKSLKEWCTIIKKSGVDENDLPNKTIKDIIIQSKKSNYSNLVELVKKLYFEED